MYSPEHARNVSAVNEFRTGRICPRASARTKFNRWLPRAILLLLTTTCSAAAPDTPERQPILAAADFDTMMNAVNVRGSLSTTHPTEDSSSVYDELFQADDRYSLAGHEFDHPQRKGNAADNNSIKDAGPQFLPTIGDWESKMAVTQGYDPAVVFSNIRSTSTTHGDDWYVLPAGLLYRSYLAGVKEPQIHWANLYDTKSDRRIWETTLGGRAGLLRYGSGEFNNAEGFQFDLEGAVFSRVLPDEPSAMLEAADFRFGFLGTWRFRRTSLKAGYYHISSHVGDEFLLANPLFNRINYVRDALIFGAIYDLTNEMQIYGEFGNAVGTQGGAKPLELQFGAQYIPSAAGFRVKVGGAPFAAVNGHLRQDFDFSGSLNVLTGWSWQGEESKSRFRVGLQYYRGPSLQYSFFDRKENLIGGGLWFDF